MSDFEDFGDPNQNNAAMDDDPAADFLAREQSELAGLEDDGLGGGAPAQNDDDFGFGGDGSGDFNQPSGQNDLLSGGGGAAMDDGGLLGDGVPGEPPQNGGLLDGVQDEPPVAAEPEAVTNGPADGYAAISQADQRRQEPETIKRWREEQKKRLETKDAAEEERREELRAKAGKELDDWYKHHGEQLDKTRESNRAAERAMVQERDETAPGHEWERICRLCEFNPKNSKSTKDVSRLRSILLQLKQTPLVR